VLLGGDGHLCLTDFGLAKELRGDEEEDMARTVCGTNEYMAPEMITRKGYGKAVDWWCVACVCVCRVCVSVLCVCLVGIHRFLAW
jgi:p70 ribosomal S6 kinase